MIATHTTVIWFFWVYAIAGTPVGEPVGQWDTMEDCKRGRQEFIDRHNVSGLMVDASLCTRRYKPQIPT